MLDPAPGLFSTTIGAPSALDKGSAKTRATKSAAPPGAKPTTSLMGREGYDCANAWLAKRMMRKKILTTEPNPKQTTKPRVSAGSTRGFVVCFGDRKSTRLNSSHQII